MPEVAATPTQLRWVMAHYGRRAHLIHDAAAESHQPALCGERPTFDQPWHPPYIAALPVEKRCPVCESLALSRGLEIPQPPDDAARRPLQAPPGALPSTPPVLQRDGGSAEPRSVMPAPDCPGEAGEHVWVRLPVRNGYYYCPVCWCVGPPRGGDGTAPFA